MDNALVNHIKDEIALSTSALDQAQKYLDTHRHLLNEGEAWNLQAEIDTQRFDIEAMRLKLMIITRVTK